MIENVHETNSCSVNTEQEIDGLSLTRVIGWQVGTYFGSYKLNISVYENMLKSL